MVPEAVGVDVGTRVFPFERAETKTVGCDEVGLLHRPPTLDAAAGSVGPSSLVGDVDAGGAEFLLYQLGQVGGAIAAVAGAVAFGFGEQAGRW